MRGWMSDLLVKVNDGVWFLASMLDGSQSPVAPALGNLTPSYVLFGYSYIYIIFKEILKLKRYE